MRRWCRGRLLSDDPEVLADPAPAYARLRAECPVHRAEVDGRPLYSVSRATDVHRILTDPAHWSNTKGPGVADSSTGAGDMQHDDPPEHTRRRKFARDWFGPAAVAELEPAIRAVTVRADRGGPPGRPGGAVRRRRPPAAR